jgi:hypothetical protein
VAGEVQRGGRLIKFQWVNDASGPPLPLYGASGASPVEREWPRGARQSIGQRRVEKTFGARDCGHLNVRHPKNLWGTLWGTRLEMLLYFLSASSQIFCHLSIPPSDICVPSHTTNK